MKSNIWKTKIPKSLQKNVEELSRLKKKKLAKSLPIEPRGWTPADGLIINGRLESGPFPINKEVELNDSLYEKNEYAPTEINHHSLTVEEARQAMIDAGEAPGSKSYEQIKKEEKVKDMLYAFSQLTFWQKIKLLIRKK